MVRDFSFIFRDNKSSYLLFPFFIKLFPVETIFKEIKVNNLPFQSVFSFFFTFPETKSDLWLRPQFRVKSNSFRRGFCILAVLQLPLFCFPKNH